MSAPITDGGPAYPHGASVKVYDSYMESHDKAKEVSKDFHPGMSLRDYFAGQALNGILSNPNTSCKIEATSALLVAAADAAYIAADAMLDRRIDK